jgi:Domain of unknown function (DUF1707)
MSRRATLRASDADREQVAEFLRHAAGEGRLLVDELEDRLGAALSAKTYAELDAVIADLPPSYSSLSVDRPSAASVSSSDHAPVAERASRMPEGMIPWLFPLAFAVTVMLSAISPIGAGVALVVVCFVGLPAVRKLYLKDHPPEPELVSKPFWQF